MGKTFIAVSALLGTIIGAGILGIPYVIMKSGFTIGLIHLALIGMAIGIVMLYLAEITLKTKGEYHLAGYAEKYLGKKGKWLMFLALIFGIYSAVLAYLIAEGQSISYLVFGNVNYGFIFGVTFWLLLASISYYGMRALKKAEPVGVLFVFIMVASIFVFTINKVNINNLNYTVLGNWFAPFGVIMFAYLAFSVVPEVKKIVNGDRRLMHRSVILAYLLAFVIYTIFAFCVLGYKGLLTPEIATITLGVPFVFLGIVTMFNASLALSTALVDSFKIDFKVGRIKAWIYAITVPLVLYIMLELTHSSYFTIVLGIGGVVSGGLTAILILLMVRKLKNKGLFYSDILALVLGALFAAGAVLEIISIIK